MKRSARDLPRPLHPRPHRLRRLAPEAGRQLLKVNPRNVDVDIDAVHRGPLNDLGQSAARRYRWLRKHLCAILEIAAVEPLVSTLQSLVHERLPDWLTQCRGSGIDRLVHFAGSLAQDGAVVPATLATNCSNGQRGDRSIVLNSRRGRRTVEQI